MVSALWKACSEGHLEPVRELLKDASSIDIEITDLNGLTPLIEAIKNGHVEIVKALLDKGADPTHGSSQALPEQYTSDPAILDLLHRAPTKMAPSELPNHEPGYAHDHLPDTEKRYYAPQPIPYAYYPGINPGIPHMHDGGIYYPPPPIPAGEHQVQGGPPNLPPPEVARLIPCRFFPACRYGASCLFAHPQGPYFPGPLPPPAQYPTPYDPMVAQTYAPNYYPIPPPSFQHPPNGLHPHVTPTSPQSAVHHTPSPMGQARLGPEMLPPPPHFNPSGVPPYGPMPPVSTYPHAGQVPIPLSMPLQHQPPPPGPQSPPQSLYTNTSPPASFVVRQEAAAQYSPQVPNTRPTYGEVNGGPKSPPLGSQPDNYGSGTGPTYRGENAGHNRRGNARRGSFGARKPPCLFYPSGRCKNGDECRFPHILTEGSVTHPSGSFPGRNGLRPRGGHVNGNGFRTIEEKLEGLTVRDDSQSRPINGADGSSRSHSTEPGSRGRFSHNLKGHHTANGTRIEKKAPVKQRVPNADEFPVLTGSTTPPSQSPGLNGIFMNGHVHSGPTAAQVLQAPPPPRKDSTKESTSPGGSADIMRPTKDPNPNGITSDVSHESQPLKHPSFAAVATAAPEVAKDVSVSA